MMGRRIERAHQGLHNEGLAAKIIQQNQRLGELSEQFENLASKLDAYLSPLQQTKRLEEVIYQQLKRLKQMENPSERVKDVSSDLNISFIHR